MVIALILIVLTSFGGAATFAAACHPQVQAASARLDHSSHDDPSDTICAGHMCCAVAVAQAQAAAEQIPLALSHALDADNLSSATLKPPFRPPIANRSV